MEPLSSSLPNRDVLAAANICPDTGLATDYLNHFNEVVMLIDMVTDMPDVIEDILNWQPISYIEHFERSGFRDKSLAMEAFALADETVVESFVAACRHVENGIAKAQNLILLDDVESLSQLTPDLYDRIGSVNGVILGTGVAATHVEANPSQDLVDALFD